MKLLTMKEECAIMIFTESITLELLLCRMRQIYKYYGFNTKLT